MYTRQPSSQPTQQPTSQPTQPTSNPTFQSNIITTYAGTGTSSYSGDGGAATSAALKNPYGVALDSSGEYTYKCHSIFSYNLVAHIGNLYVTDSGNYRIRKVTISTGVINTIIGTGTIGFSGDNGPATSATIHSPFGITVDMTGNVYFGDCNVNRIRKLTVSTGIIASIAGSSTSGGYSGDNGPATTATLNQAWGVSLDSADNVYVTDTSNYRIRKITVATGTINSVAGNGSPFFNGNNIAATSATLYGPHCSALDTSGNIYITDTWNHRIRKVEVSTSIITTFAGTGTSGYSGDNGAATSAKLNSPFEIALDSTGSFLYIADSYNNIVRKVAISTGIIVSIAGSSTSGSYSGDGGFATSAGLNTPYGLAIDTAGMHQSISSIN